MHVVSTAVSLLTPFIVQSQYLQEDSLSHYRWHCRHILNRLWMVSEVFTSCVNVCVCINIYAYA